MKVKKVIVSGVLCAVAVFGGAQAASAETTTTSTKTNAEMLAQIQDLMKLITDLQAKIAEARGEIKELVKDLSVGAEGDDVKEIQELLASDPELFKVKPTGYYGPLTEEAIKKFQARYGLPVTGVVDEATREVMRELKMERKNGMVPPGLVKSDEVKARIKARLEEKWGTCIWGEKFRASDCVKGDDSDDEEEDEQESEDDDSDDDSTDATRQDALDAIDEAQTAINELKDSIEEMVDGDASDEDIEDAEENLIEAKKKLAEARKKFFRRDYDGAVDKAEESLETATGDDDSSDDEDDDSDDSDDDDEDDDSDDDDSDDSNDDDEDDD